MKRTITLVAACFLVSSACSAAFAAAPSAPPVMSKADIDTKAAEVESSILSGDFAAAEGAVEKLVAERVRSRSGDLAVAGLLEALFAKPGFTYEAKIEELLRSRPKSVTAHLLAAEFFQNYAWQARGTKYAVDVPAEATALYRQRLMRSLELLRKGEALDGSNGLVHAQLVQTAKEVGMPVLERKNHFTKAAELLGDYLSLYIDEQQNYAPQWGGSEESLLAFARESAKKGGPDSPLQMLLPLAHHDLCRLHGGRKANLSRPEVWREVKEAWSALRRRFPDSGNFLTGYAEDAITVGEVELGTELIRDAEKRDPAHPEVRRVLAKHADILSGGGKEAGPSASQIAKEGYAFSQQGRFEEARAAFSKAIELNSKKARYYTQRCHANMMLGLLEPGIADCTQAIARDAREKDAYLLRGRALQMLGKAKEADADFTVAASLP